MCQIEEDQRGIAALSSDIALWGSREFNCRGRSFAEDLRRGIEPDRLVFSRGPLHTEQKCSGQQDDEDDPQGICRDLWPLFGYHLGER